MGWLLIHGNFMTAGTSFKTTTKIAWNFREKKFQRTAEASQLKT